MTAKAETRTIAIDATLMGIIYHPELRGKLSESAQADIRKMLASLAVIVERTITDRVVE